MMHKVLAVTNTQHQKLPLTNSSLHYFIMQGIVSNGFAPKIADISNHFNVSREDVVKRLQKLQDYHGVVLHPKSSEVWVMHPFANAPTNFWITSENGSWWGNCGWCSLGAAALLDRDLSITTTLGAEGKQVVIEIKNGQLLNKNLYVHFPVPMAEAWDNVTYTCSTMLVFDSEDAVSDWCNRHNIAKGDVQPIQTVWEFSKVWYGNHLKPDWIKWTTEDAVRLFEQFGLTNPVWNISANKSRF